MSHASNQTQLGVLQVSNNKHHSRRAALAALDRYMAWFQKGFLTFFGSLYKEVAKNYFRNFGISLRETNRKQKYFFLPKTLNPRL